MISAGMDSICCLIDWRRSEDRLVIDGFTWGNRVFGDLSDSAQSVSASLDVNGEVFSGYFRAIGAPSPNLRVDTEGTVAFLANVPVEGNVGLYCL